MEASKRVRFVFRDDDILSDTQESDGLLRTWVLLKPGHHDTVSDVASHLLDAFRLHQSCPHGLLLSISGFVLPPFESTSILKDDEIISVRKKRQFLPVEGNDASNEVKRLKAAEKQPVNSGILLLANEEFEKEKGGYESDDNEEEGQESLSVGNEEPKCRKRKAAEKLKGSKKKKQRSEAGEYATNKILTGKTESSFKKMDRAGKNSISREEKKDDSTDEDIVENNEECSKSSEEDDVSVDGMKGNGEENGKENEDPKKDCEDKKKGPSRSARRKYAKRRWLKEMKKIQKQNMNCESEGLKNWKEDQAKRNKAEKGQQRWKKQQADGERNDDGQPKGLLHWMQSPHNDSFAKGGKKRGRWNQNTYINKHSNQKSDFKKQGQNGDFKKQDQNRNFRKKDQKSDEHQQPTQNSDGLEQPNQMEVDVPEQKIRKNCIEGDPIQNNDAPEQPNEESDDEDNEVVPVEIRPGHIRFEPLGKEAGKAVQKNHAPSETFQWNGITSKKKGQQWGKESRSFTPQSNVKNTSKVYSEISGNEKKLDAGVSLDRLPPFTSLPKEGDIIAYRILELSPSWTPELSDFRVGKVSWYHTESGKTLLMPVPEYPFCSPDECLYKEDGSLEVAFSSLIDARFFQNEGVGSGNESHGRVNESVGGNEDTSETAAPGGQEESTVAPKPEQNQSKEIELPTSGNGGTDIWEQISEALNAKKDQLSKETGWGKTPEKVQQPVQENKWEECATNFKSSPNSNWGKNPQKAQPSQQSAGNKSWSYRALRGSALGPTMSMLRSRKNA